MSSSSPSTTDTFDLDYWNRCPSTIKKFHECFDDIRCIVGSVGSGKTSAASMEVGLYLPRLMFEEFGVKSTRFAIVRNTYIELVDTTQRTVKQWFPWGRGEGQNDRNFTLRYPEGYEVELLFRSCDRPQDVKKFKSLEITGYWEDESVEISPAVRQMLKNRIGRWPPRSPLRFGIETTNPPYINDSIYNDFTWNRPPPGPPPQGDPLEGHAGFWQHPRENEHNLKHGYYDDLIKDYKNNPDWIRLYIDGKPGIIIQGKLVYANWNTEIHVAEDTIPWRGKMLYCGWDNSGNTPACIVAQRAGNKGIEVLREFTSEKMGIVDFTKWVAAEMNESYPDHEAIHYADPAGEAKFSKESGGFTSNAKLMRQCGVDPIPAEQNPAARINAVDQQMLLRDGLLVDPSCFMLLGGFEGGYVYPEHASLIGEYKENVLKNKYAHLQEGLQYLAVSIFQAKSTRQPDMNNPIDALRALDERARSVYSSMHKRRERSPQPRGRSWQRSQP